MKRNVLQKKKKSTVHHPPPPAQFDKNGLKIVTHVHNTLHPLPYIPPPTPEILAPLLHPASLTATFQSCNRGVSSNFHSAPPFTAHANERQRLVGMGSNGLIDKASPFYYGRMASYLWRTAMLFPIHLSPDLPFKPLPTPQFKFESAPSLAIRLAHRP